MIGAQVFGRRPDYDTNEDPVVRVRAADVRKRLAQYYLDCRPGTDGVRIDLQAGSYRAHFRWNEPRPQPAEAQAPPAPAVSPQPQPPLQPQERETERSRPRRRAGWLLSRWSITMALGLGLIVSLIVTAGTIALNDRGPSGPVRRFWAPLTALKRPVVVYLGTNAGYVFRKEYLRRYRSAHNLPDNGQEFFVELSPGESVAYADLAPVRDSFVTAPDIVAILQLFRMFDTAKTPYVLRVGKDLSFGDLRNQPGVMIGAFNNAWTLELTRDLPYSFQHGVEIHDRDHPDQSWTVPGDPSEETTDDYALVSRLLVSKTGGPVIAVAGIGDCGTQAAAEFLVNPDRMAEFLKSAPAGWERRNVQFVLHVRIVAHQPVLTEMVASRFW